MNTETSRCTAESVITEHLDKLEERLYELHADPILYRKALCAIADLRILLFLCIHDGHFRNL